MTDECLALLKPCCGPAALHALELLVSKDQMYEARARTACSRGYFLKVCAAAIVTAVFNAPPPSQVRCVAEEGAMPPSEGAEDVYERAERLFASSNVSLKRGGGALKAEINQRPGHLPLVLCIAIRGLASLAHGD